MLILYPIYCFPIVTLRDSSVECGNMSLLGSIGPGK